GRKETLGKHGEKTLVGCRPRCVGTLQFPTREIDSVTLPRTPDFPRRLHQLHRVGDDEAIDSEFSAVCRAIWGYTLDDFTDDDLSPEDHLWLDGLTQECAFDFAAQQGYDLKDYIHGGSVADWWGFTWMILAEARQVLTPEKRVAAWCRHGEKTWWA